MQFMGYKKVFIVVNISLVCREILGFVSDFFFFVSYSLVFPFICRSCKRNYSWKEKDEDIFRLKLYFRVKDYSVVEMFSGPCRNCRLTQTRP